MDRLTSMRMFARVVESGSFTGAADGTGVTATMVANHVKSLEHHLGVQLLSRTTRINEVTEAGREYYTHCLTIIRAIDDVDDAIRQTSGAPTGVLRVTAPISFGTENLAPMLNDYILAFSDVRIDLQLSDQVVDLVKEHYDVAIRIGPPRQSSDLTGRHVCQWRRILCASPAYLRRRGTPEIIQDLRIHDCLCYAYASGPEREWRFQTPDGGFDSIEVKCILSINNGHALRNAAIAGLGVIFQPEALVAPALKDGRLVRILTSYVSSHAPLRIYTRANHRLTPKVSTFVEYVLEHFHDHSGA